MAPEVGLEPTTLRLTVRFGSACALLPPFADFCQPAEFRLVRPLLSFAALCRPLLRFAASKGARKGQRLQTHPESRRPPSVPCYNSPSFYAGKRVRWLEEEQSVTITDRIEINPKVMVGKPVIRGTRIPVELILRKLSEGATEKELLRAYQIGRASCRERV